MRVAIYGRVSTGHRAEQQTIEQQIERLTAQVATHVAEGWTQQSTLTAPELAGLCAAAGISRLLVTSATRDGSLAGPDLALLGAVIDASGLPVIAAGGIASLGDLRRLKEIGCEGAVLGSALWSGRITLAEATASSPGA